MITLHDIETAVCDRLKSAGHTVTAAEVDEGFDKPTFFIDIFQNSATPQNPFMELVNVGVELKYIHDTPTREVMVETADALSTLFTASALKVQDRFLSVLEITFDTENNALYAYFELEFMRETAAAIREYEKISSLNINLKTGVIASGTSTGTD